MLHRVSVLLAILGVLVLVAACGGGAAPAPTAAPAKPAAAEPTKAAAPAVTSAPAAAAPTSAPAAAPAKSTVDGKNVELIIPNSAGGGIDTVARYTAPYLKKYSNAKDVVVNNVVGAASIKGMNQLAVAKGDGSTIGFASVVTMTLQQLSGQEGVQFDAGKFNYLGKAYSESRIVIAPAKGNIKTIQDVIAKKNLVMPIQGLDDDFLSFSVVAKQLGLQIKAITGFAGQADVFLSAMRGEGDLCSTGYKTAAPMIAQGDMRPILIVGPKRIADYPDVPTATEVVTGADAKSTLEVISNLLDMQMSYIAPPSMDAKLVAEFRDYTTKALSDKEAVDNAKAKIGGREIMFIKGVDEQKAIADTIAAGQKIVPILKDAVASVK